MGRIPKAGQRKQRRRELLKDSYCGYTPTDNLFALLIYMTLFIKV